MSSSVRPWPGQNERTPGDPVSALKLAKTRAASLEKSIPELKEKLVRIRDLEHSDAAMYLRYNDSGKLEEFEKQLTRYEGLLVAWRAMVPRYETEIPIYQDLMKKAEAWIATHAKEEKKAADQFRSKIGSIQGELTELLGQFRTQGWEAPQGLTEVEGKDLLLRTMVNHLGGHPPPDRTYTWEINNPGKRNYDL